MPPSSRRFVALCLTPRKDIIQLFQYFARPGGLISRLQSSNKETFVSMSRITLAAYDQLRKAITAKIAADGFVPPARELADIFHCSPVTAWRIVKSLGYEAKGHRWIKVKK